LKEQIGRTWSLPISGAFPIGFKVPPTCINNVMLKTEFDWLKTSKIKWHLWAEKVYCTVNIRDLFVQLYCTDS